jgi:hypothetical protein
LRCIQDWVTLLKELIDKNYFFHKIIISLPRLNNKNMIKLFLVGIYSLNLIISIYKYFKYNNKESLNTALAWACALLMVILYILQ